MKEVYQVYAKIDEKGRVIAIDSSAFLQDTEGWTVIDEGHGDKFHHAQNNYIKGPLFDKVPLYELKDGKIKKRKKKDIDDEVKALPVEKSLEERVDELWGIVDELKKKVEGGKHE